VLVVAVLIVIILTVIILRRVLSADEFYEAYESRSGAAAAGAESGETDTDASDRAHNDCDTDKPSVPPSDGVTADSDVSLQLRETAAIDKHVANDTENTATDVSDVLSDVNSTSAKLKSTSQPDASEHTNGDAQSHVDTDLPADGLQCELKDDVSGGESQLRPTDILPADDTIDSQELDVADSHVPAENVSSQSEAEEAAGDVDEFSQLTDTQSADADHIDELDPASLSDNCQETSGTSLPLHLVNEPSTADSNDDTAEFVEASTSLNPELDADTPPVTDGEIQPTDQQQLEDEDDDNKDDEQFVDSTSDISPPQPAEGNVGM